MRFTDPKSFLILIFLTVISFQYCVAQFTDEEISRLTYEEMYTIYRDEEKRYLSEIFPLHIAKAKKEKDTLQWASAYRYKSWDVENLEDALNNLDTATAIIKSYQSLQKDSLGIVMSQIYYSKGAAFHNYDLIESAAEAFIQSFHWAKKNNNIDQMIHAMYVLSYYKAAYGQESEAILLQKKALELVKRNKNKIVDYNEVYLEGLGYLGYGYLFAKKTDSSRFYIDKYLKLSTKLKWKPDLEDVIVLNAELDYYDGRLLKAKDTLTKYVRISDGTNKADRLYYLGMIEGELGKPDVKKKHFRTVDSIMKSIGYPLVDNINQIYQFLFKDAIDNNEHANEQIYFRRLVYYDSLLARTQERLRQITLEKLDLPYQEAEKQELNKAIASKEKLIFIFYVLSFLLVFGFFGYYLKYRNTKKRLELALKQPVELETGNFSKSFKEPTIDIDVGILQEILKNVDHWEKEKGFLDNTVNQQSLAKTLNTNSSYLSQVINVNKGHNFSSYLKDLRITYAINNLKSSPDVVKGKSMIQIAELYGFSSLAVFNKAFKAKVGVTPGVFLKQIAKVTPVL
ncbi:AraC family transcriptional regulator [Flagellimonas sp. CMM7]|uniref:helix-turn-helix domain-containing protein n=1 Tax=Flagellimonas sp. CMM7 TaxID=2654676 RepID=UPI0013D33DC6|nr:helix-turn-helix domain-containing protein [Flagellimonas sp. CMM7]UII79684.1 helix-turn-helix domain-containing protein [Flagellimonas sp. CMM7]